MDEALIYFGDAVKAMGGGKVGGYLVLFSTDSDPDLTGDFFTKNTDFFFDEAPKAVILYDHGLDPTLKARKLGRGSLRIDDVGVWVETQLELRDEYEKAIYAMAEAGKLGWSSGSAPHLVERTPVKKSVEIKSWPIVEASLTPVPTEPRTAAITLKSYRDEKALDELCAPVSDAPSTIEGPAPAAMPFVEQLEAALAAADVVVVRAKSIQEIRKIDPRKSGRAISSARRSRLGEFRASLLSLADELQGLLDETEAKLEEKAEKSADPAEISNLLAQFESYKFARISSRAA